MYITLEDQSCTSKIWAATWILDGKRWATQSQWKHTWQGWQYLHIYTDYNSEVTLNICLSVKPASKHSNFVVTWCVNCKDLDKIRNVRMSGNGDWERNWEWLWLILRYWSWHLHGRTEKNHDNLSHDDSPIGWYLNRGPPKYEARVSTTILWLFIIIL
jgi:hypothetical protein